MTSTHSSFRTGFVSLVVCAAVVTSTALADTLPLNTGNGIQNEPNRDTGRDSTGFVPTLGGSALSAAGIVANPVTSPTFWTGSMPILGGGGGGGGGGAGGVVFSGFVPSGGSLVSPPAGNGIGGTAAGSSFTAFTGSVTLPEVSNATLPPQAGGNPGGNQGSNNSTLPSDTPASVPEGGVTAVLLGAALLSLAGVRRAVRR